FASVRSVNHARQQLRSARVNWLTQAQRLAEAYARKEILTIQVRDLKSQLLEREPGIGADSPLGPLLGANGLPGLSPEAKERLWAALGLDWNSSSDYILVSKATLKNLSLDGFRGNQLADAACGVLAITPEERAQVDAAFETVGEQFADWAKAHAEREGPSGETLVRYTIPAGPEVAQSLTNTLFSAIRDALGQERSEVLQNFARNWLQVNVGCLGAVTNVLT